MNIYCPVCERNRRKLIEKKTIHNFTLINNFKRVSEIEVKSEKATNNSFL